MNVADQRGTSQLDAICQKFLVELDNGEPPAIGEFLAKFPAEQRRELFQRLFAMEYSHTLSTGAAAKLSDWYRKYEAYTVDLDQFFASAAFLRTTDVAATTDPVAGPVVAALEPGQQVAGYQLISEIGRGGMGVVYKARQSGLTGSLP